MDNQITYKPNSYYKLTKDKEIIYLEVKDCKNNELFCDQIYFIEKSNYSLLQNEITDIDVNSIFEIDKYSDYVIEEIDEKEFDVVYKLYCRIGPIMQKRYDDDKKLKASTEILIDAEIKNQNFDKVKELIQQHPFDVGRLELIQKYKSIFHASETNNQ